MRAHLLCASCCLLAVLSPALVRAGVVNPDISVIGQPVATWTDAAGDAARQRVSLGVGESEFVFDSALNPYARGLFVLSLADGAAEVEEAFFTMDRGLPLGLVLKGGKYRAGFGKLNAVHPHAYPFAERFHVLARYLPGEESFNETGVQVSERLPAPGDIALTASLDVLQGDSFRMERESSGAADDPLGSAEGDRAAEPRPAALGRVSAFMPVGDRSGLELGATATQGTNNVAAATRTNLVGGDAKLKLWTSSATSLVVQAELLHLARDEAGWDSVTARYTRAASSATGGYAFANLTWSSRYNAGLSYERFQTPDAARATDQAFGAFAGLALMEETTLFRLSYEHRLPGRAPGEPDSPAAIRSLRLGVIFSMGPHKPHQF